VDHAEGERLPTALAASPRDPTSHASEPSGGAARFWIVVASKDHVERGVAGRFMQACHGKAAPLRRIRPGDGVLFYSPRRVFGQAARCQAFTALAYVEADDLWQTEMPSL
jgi:hypothetical protein